MSSSVEIYTHDEIIDLSTHRTGNGIDSRKVKSLELNVLLNVANEVTGKQYGPILLCEVLLKERIISKRAYYFLSKIYEEGEEFRKVLVKLHQFCSLASLIYALYVCSYTDIADILHKNGCDFRPTQSVSVHGIPKQDSCHKSAVVFYITLKKSIDNDALIDKAGILQSKSTQLSNDLKNLRPDHTRRKECLTDKLMVVKCLTVEVTTNPEKRFAEINKIDQDNALSHKTIAKAPIYGKEACTHALVGDFETAEQLIMKARLILINVKTSWVVYYHYLNELFLKVAEFKKQPSEETKQSLLFYGFSGLKAVVNESKTTLRQWKRMYISFMLYGVLNLGLFLEEIQFPITREDRELARTLMLEFNRLSEGMETRRDMLYAFFMSRLHEDEDIQLAMTYAKRAVLLSDIGELRKGEKENIAAFFCKLTMKAWNSLAF